MAGYLLYLPGRRGCNPSMIAEHGLATLCGEDTPMFRDVLEHGPDGGNGVLCYWEHMNSPERNHEPAIVDTTRQEWRPAKANGDQQAGRYWIGWDKSRPVRPSDILRRRSHVSTPVILEDGNEWLIPIAKQLPQVLGLDERGMVAGRIKDQYREFWDQSWKVLDWFQPREDGTCAVPYTEGFEFCCLALSVNYVVNRDIVDALGLIGTGDNGGLFSIPKAVIELDALLKKNLADSQPSSAGEAG